MGPISQTTIDADTKVPKLQRLNVTVTLQIDVMNMPDVHLDAVASALTRSEWSDGRYPFHQEMLQEGLRQDVHAAIRRVVQEKMFAKHGRENGRH